MNYEFEIRGFRNEKISMEDCTVTDITYHRYSITFADGIMVRKDTMDWDLQVILCMSWTIIQQQ